MLNNLEKQTSVPKVYAVLGAAGLYFFFVLLNFGGQILTNLAGFVIPGYYSLEAIFSAEKADDTQWLTVCHDLCSLSLQLLTNLRTVLGRVWILHVSIRT